MGELQLSLVGPLWAVVVAVGGMEGMVVVVFSAAAEVVVFWSLAEVQGQEVEEADQMLILDKLVQMQGEMAERILLAMREGLGELEELQVEMAAMELAIAVAVVGEKISPVG